MIFPDYKALGHQQIYLSFAFIEQQEVQIIFKLNSIARPWQWSTYETLAAIEESNEGLLLSPRFYSFFKRYYPKIFEKIISIARWGLSPYFEENLVLFGGISE